MGKMGYIEKEKVKQIRESVKKAFPQFKFSIVWEHYSTVQIRIMQGPIDLGTKEFNPYYPENTENQAYKEMCVKIMEIVRSIAEVKYHETGDYGTQPSYYCYIKIGKWDKPYQLIK